MVSDDLLETLDYPDTDATERQIIRKGDARDLPLEDECVDLVFTSPPYWRKRDYGHEDQLGQEPTPEEYVESLMSALDEWRKVLRESGTVLLNIGDKFQNTSRIGLPWKVAEAARNRGWRVRGEIVWHKPNGMPTPVRDRFNTRHEYIFHLAPEWDYYFDKFGFESVYNDPVDVWRIRHDRNEKHLAPFPEELVRRGLIAACPPAVCESCGQPRERIVEKNPAKLNSDRQQARRAMERFEQSDLGEEHLKAIQAVGIADAGKGRVVQNGTGGNSDDIVERAEEAKDVLGGYFREFTFPEKTTVGWTECDCDDPYTVPGTVLDPFAGSGTTIEVAEELGLSAVGVDIDPPDDSNRFMESDPVETLSRFSE